MIIVKLKGGMGNQMFQYALGRTLSLKNNTQLGLDLSYLKDRTPRSNFTFRDYDLDIFNIKAEIIPQSKISFVHKTYKGKLGLFFDYFKRKLIKIKGIEKSLNFNSNVLDLGNNIYLDGYWQSYKYFESIKDVIRKDFTIKNKFPLHIESLKKEIENCNSLCLHIRRGDYVNNPIYFAIEENYYNLGIEKINSFKKIDKIYIFSDDIKWCRENIDFDLPVMFVDEEYAGEKTEGHLFLMKSCKNFVIPNSTFSWWAAWLSEHKDKIVIAPKQWLSNGSINSDDLIPKTWIKI